MRHNSWDAFLLKNNSQGKNLESHLTLAIKALSLSWDCVWLHGTTRIVLRRSRRFIMAPHGPSVLTNTCAHTLSFNDRLTPHSHYKTALLVCLVCAVLSAARDWCHARLNNMEALIAWRHCEFWANWWKCHMAYRTAFYISQSCV